MKDVNKVQALKLVDEMYVHNNEVMSELLNEFIDRVEADDHIFFVLKERREIHDQLITLENLLNDEV